jgi:photosystem II stability/assembly factor-like uncharacterized protein
MRGRWLAGVVAVLLLAGCGSAAHIGGTPEAGTARIATQSGAPSTAGFGPITFLSDEVGYVALAGSPDILHTINGGRTWTHEHLPGGLQAEALDFLTPTSGVAVAASSCGASSSTCASALLFTKDGGAHWTVTDRRAYPATALQGFDAVTPPGGPLDALLQGELLGSVNGGTSWTRTSTPPGVHADLIASLASNVLFLGGTPCPDAGVCTTFSLYRSPDRGASWNTVWTGSGPPAALQMVSASVGYLLVGPNPETVSMGGASGELYETTDGGSSWTLIQSSWTGAADGGFQGSMNWSGPDVGWIPVNAGAGPGFGGLEVTGDAGRHWTRLGLAADWSITDAALVSPTNGFVAGVSRQPSGDIPFLAETTDGGATWQQILPALTPTRTLQMLTPGTGFGLGLAMDPGQLTVTHNGGRSWSPVGPASLRGLDPALIAFTSRTSGDVLALPPNDYLSAPARLFHTTDGGVTWSAGRPVPLYQLTAFCMAGRDGIALGMDRALEGRVLLTSNGGRTFLAGAGAPPTWAAAACAPDARNLYVTTVRPTPPGAKKAGWTGARLVLKRVQVATGRSQVLHVWPDPHGALRYEPAPVDMLPGGTGYLLTSVERRSGYIKKPAGAGKRIRVPATTSTFQLWVTHDHGKNWQSLTFPARDQGLLSGYIALDFVSSRIGFLLTDAGLFRTLDGGRVWRQVADGSVP